MDDDRDAEYAIRALDRSEYGRKGRRLRVEWSKHEPVRKPVSSRRSGNQRPSKTLFVINFPFSVKTMDLERHFDPYGKIVNVRIRKNFAFVQFETQEDATRALDATNMSKLHDRVISVEYSTRDDDERRGGGYSPDRRFRDRSPDRRRRSPSPYRRERGSPDYGTGSSPVAYRRERGSPDYGTRSSPAAYRRERGSPVYGTRSSRSPRRVDRSPKYGARSSRSPRRVDRGSEYDNVSNRSPRQTRHSPDVRDHDRNRSPRDEERNGNGNGYGRRPNRSPSPYPEEGAISDDAQEPRSPIEKPDMRERSPIKKTGYRDSSPVGEYGSPINASYQSSSPPARERSQS